MTGFLKDTSFYYFCHISTVNTQTITKEILHLNISKIFVRKG